MSFWLNVFLAAVGRLRGKKTVCRVKCGPLTLFLRPRVEALEWRVAPSVGGGFTGGGLYGQYFDNTTLTGTPSFTRTDVRINFTWGTTLPPGGSIAVGYSAIGTTDYSILWTGQVVPRYSETYTFYVTADDGAQLYIRPTGTTTWTTLVNDWTNRPASTDSGSFTMVAGQAYDIELEHYQATDAGQISLQWSSPSTPKEVIEPVDQQGWNILPDEFPLYTNRMWGPLVQWTSGTHDSLDNPTSDGTVLVWQGVANNEGTYQVVFNGQAQLNVAFGYGTFSQSYVQNGNTFTGVYNAATNTTTATMIVTDTGLENFYLSFINSRRTPTSAIDTGVTNIQVMAPTTVGGSTPYSPNVYFTPQWEAEAAQYSALRAYPAIGTAYNTTEVNWSNRVEPNNTIQDQFGFYGGLAWEWVVQLANETGKDLWINIPEDATGTSPTDTTSYIYQLAKLIADGSTDSNGVFHPGLNSNLNLYIEYSNEVWNYGFSAFSSVAAQAQAAGPSSPINYDGQAFDSNGNVTNTGIFREQGERVVDISNIFRAVFGNSQMITRIRPVLEWQLGYNSPNGQIALEYIDQYYNNDDGINHVANPHPVSYYVYGGGGSDYFNATNDPGYTTLVTNDSFETPTVSGFQQDPTGATWSFSGTAGIAANGSSLNNPTAIDGKQVAYLEGVNGTNGSLSESVTFPANQTSDVYAVSFDAVEQTPAGSSVADSQSIDVYFDNTLIGSFTPDAYDPNNPWPEFDTNTFTVTAPGSAHTIRLVGTSTSGTQIAFVDQVRITSVDAIFNSGIPDPTYVPALQSDAELAGAFGIKYVSYEGGFAVGGDFKTPVQTAAYDDPRAQQALIAANTDYQQVGGSLFFNGTYAMQGNDPGTLNTPLLEGVRQLDATLPAAPTLFGITGPATLPVLSSVYSYNANADTGAMSQGGWFRWDVYVPVAGQYNLSSDAGAGGTVQLLVDDVSLGSLNSANSLTAAPLNVTLTSGLHVIEVRDVSGAFTLKNAFLNAGPAPTTGPALDVFNFTGNTGSQVTVNPTTSAAGLTASAISRGSGLQPDSSNSSIDSNSFGSVSTTNVYGQTFAAAITDNQYYQFTLAPQAGVAMSFSSLAFAPEFQNAYAGNGAGITYSVDGVNFTQLTASGTPGSGNPFTVNLGGAAALQGTTSTVTFRIYLWGNGAYESTALGGNGNAVIVYGSATSGTALPAGITATSGSGQSATVNTSFTNALVVTVKDANGNPVSGVSVTFAAPATGASVTFPSGATVTTGANGQASDTIKANTVAGSYTVTATASGVTNPASFSETNTAGAANSIAVTSGSGQSATVNTSFTNALVVTVKDANGNPVSGVSVTFAAPTSGASATFPSGATVTTGASGQASDTIKANTVAGSYTVMATASGVTNPASFSETNTAGAAASIAVTSGSGQSATVNTTFGSPVLVTVKDAFGNPVSGASVTFAAPTTGASATFPSGATATTGTTGQASGTIKANTVAGSYTVTATTGSLTTSPSFSETNSAGTAASIAVTSGSGQSATVNTAFGSLLVATVKDSFGNPVSGASVTFAAPTTGASATFPSGATATTGTTGQASDTITANAVAGSYTVTATTGSFTTSPGFSETNVTGTAGSIAVTSGSGQSATVNTSFTNALVVTVKDANGNPVSGVSVTFAAPASGASATFPSGATVTTGASGQASDTIKANTVAGSYTVTATASGVTNPASFSETNTAGAAASIVVTSGSGQSATVNTTFGSAVLVTVKDAFGNPVSGASVTFAAPTTGASATFPSGATATTGTTGQAGDTIKANTVAGSYTVTATTGSLTTSPSFSETNSAGTAASIAVTSGSGQSATVNTSFTNALVVTVKDANGNPVSGVSVTFAAPASGASATFPSGATVTTGASGQASDTIKANTVAGSYTVTATASGVSTPAAFSLTNTAASLGIFTASADIGAPATAGSAGYTAATQTYTVQGGGNDIWNESDQFHYVDTTVNGNATIIAQVTSVTDTDPWAKAGVMFRNGTAASAAFALVAVTPGNGIAFQWRTSAGAQAQNINITGLTAPIWVELVDSGNTFTASYSTNGSTWTAVAPAQTIAMATPTVGLVVSAHNSTLLNTSTFSNVSIITPPAAPSSLTATAASSGQINLTWTNHATNQTGFQVDEATNSSFTQGLVTVTLAANATSFSAKGLATSTTYYFRVRATNVAGASANSNTASATTQGIGIFTATADIGAPATAGSASYNAATQTYTVQGGGNDIWNESDQFRYVYTGVSGDTTLSAEVTSVSNSDPWAKAGVMFRDGTAANAAFALVAVTPSNGIAFQWRTSAGVQAQNINITGLTAPAWVELVRRGNTFTAYYSTDGVNWIMIGSPQTIVMAAPTAGLAVTAHDSVLLNTSTFTNVRMTTP